MNRHAAIELDWADGTYTFRLGISDIEELEAKRDLSIYEIARRMHPDRPEARITDISEVLRIGLIGGGTKPTDALAKVRRYVEERPVEENRDVAYAVVLAALARVHSRDIEEPPKGEVGAAKSPE
jgi:hypothetical protein